MINSYERTISQYNKNQMLGRDYRLLSTTKEELSDLLDFVQDIPEKKYEPVIENSRDEEIEKVRNYNGLLEMKNEELRLDNISWQRKCNEFEEKNNSLTETLKNMPINLQTKETNI